MSKKNKEHLDNEDVVNEETKIEEEVMPDAQAVDGETKAEDSEKQELTPEERLQAELDAANAEIAKAKNDYLFLRAEFDNFRKRTLKEKSELLINGGERAFKGLLPVIDDFERAIGAFATTDDLDSIKQGIELIYNKFTKYLNDNGVKKIEAKGNEFDTDFHEAMTLVPVEDDEQKGKVIDVIEEGYTMNDKVIRHSKVVVGK
ncbi:MAG: nucleotide exchange factor GrpE [Muribaculaceae bacterium]|nr:nucleotide exchange factor GrpE [Muribaculaceae bacterium]